MAPEFPPSIVTFDLTVQNDRLLGSLEYVESSDFSRHFTLNWSALKAPENYREIGGGVAYVHDENRQLKTFLKEQAVPAPLGNGRYLWSEGLQTGLPSMMCILILPSDMTILDPEPKLTGAKLFHDRIALYWMLKRTDQDRFAIEWTLAPIETDLKTELERINRSYLSIRPRAGHISVEDAPLDSVRAASGRDYTLPQLNSVFLVHGHDEAAVQIVARFLEQLGVKPVILHEQINQGRTVIEKFEDFAGRAGFAIVLMTPDDQGHATSSPKKKMFRPRQNVILELGYFAARLGRSRTFVLKKGDIEIPSDLLGLVYQPMDSTDGWKIHLARELLAAGFQIDLNRAIA